MGPVTSRRIPTLDGWRGIAILMVLFAHYQMLHLGHFLFGLNWLDVGQHGVLIFFVLSGYIITAKLISTEKIDLRQFYVRRVCRLVPAAWAYLFFLEFLTHVVHMNVIGSDIWCSLFFFRNYSHANPITGHFWSLSVEEQFYVVWPLVLVLFRRRYSVVIASIAIVAFASYRTIHWNLYENDGGYFTTQMHADELLTGCILAFLLTSEPIRAIFIRYGERILPLLLLALVACMYFYQRLIPFPETVTVALLIGITVTNPSCWLGRGLELEHLKTTGVMSYSLYLWQQLFLWSNWGAFGVFLLSAATLFSYLCIERPGIRLGHWLTCKLFQDRTEHAVTSDRACEQI